MDHSPWCRKESDMNSIHMQCPVPMTGCCPLMLGQHQSSSSDLGSCSKILLNQDGCFRDGSDIECMTNGLKLAQK